MEYNESFTLLFFLIIIISLFTPVSFFDSYSVFNGIHHYEALDRSKLNAKPIAVGAFNLRNTNKGPFYH